jgi:hypothetical protein
VADIAHEVIIEATALAGTTSLNKFAQLPWAEIRPSKLPGMALFALLYMGKLSIFVWAASNTSIWPVLDFSSPGGGSCVCDFWTFGTYPIYKFGRSIDSASQGLLSTSLAARRNQLLLCCDTKHVAQGAPYVLSVKRIRFKPLDPFFSESS